jgi:hypothetical protein
MRNEHPGIAVAVYEGRAYAETEPSARGRAAKIVRGGGGGRRVGKVPAFKRSELQEVLKTRVHVHNS